MRDLVAGYDRSGDGRSRQRRSEATTRDRTLAPASGLNEATFRDFYTRTASGLRAYLHHAIGDAADADDLLQDAFVRLLGARNLPRSDEERRRYLYRIASNLVVDHFRRRQRERPWEARHAMEPHAQAGRDSDARLDMARTFARLRPRDRMLLWLAYVVEADHEEIARAVNVGHKSVKVLLFRARRKLAALLGA